MSDKQGAPILPPLSGGGGNNGGTNNPNTQQTVSLQQVLAAGQSLNVLTTSAGQQFVITSQVPGLGPVISSATTTAGLQQVGVTRIVNIAGTTPRVSVVGVSSNSSSSSSNNNSSTSSSNTSTLSTTTATTANRINTTKVVLSPSSKLVRTTLNNMFLTPTSVQSINSSSPPVKKLKLNDTSDKITVIEDTTTYRRRIMEHKIRRMCAIRDKYSDNASELFFLHNGGNMMDYQAWKKKARTPTYLHFLHTQKLDPTDDDEDLTVPLTTDITNLLTITNTNVNSTITSNEVKMTGVGVTPVAVSTTLPAAVAQLSQQGGTPIIPEQLKVSSLTAVTPIVATSTATTTVDIEKSQLTISTPATTITTTAAAITTTVDTVKTTTTASSSSSSSSSTATLSQPVVKLVKLPSIQQQQQQSPTAAASSLTNDSLNNQEQIVEKAKQEAYVMQRITELQRVGLWSEKRLPKVQEPTRTKAHWDYLLEEMVWLAADFAQERKWKKAAAKKCARMVQKHFQEKAIQAQKAEKLQELRLKKIAGFVAKEIKTFWSNVEKLVEFKQQTRLEEKRKKALDQHLNFIVGQTEKYSTWLTEGLNKTDGNQSVPASINSSRISSPVQSMNKINSDDEFEPNQSSDDDEETIAKAEEEMQSTTNHKEEVELLKKESELPLEDFLKELPPNYLEERDKILSPNSVTDCIKDGEVDEEEGNDDENEDVDEDEDDEEEELEEEDREEEHEEEKENNGDEEFKAVSGESSDDEDTILEQENQEGKIDHRQELDDLKAENDMTIDELMAKYSGMSDAPMEIEEEDNSDQDSEEEIDDDDADEKSGSELDSEGDCEDKSQAHSDDETGVGLKSLLEDLSPDNLRRNDAEEMQSERHNEMDDVAALAESIQPKGNTLLTTSVVTKIPFLLKHSLREYQHIGLDWLVTMYDRKLNGILADEMGLGKTVQTIALLAHLACEKSNWGPHLIIVPTSVMLNWEMECKKWCPGFKILTYYGTQKERKQKRTGWTKPNAFHICITSYKLVIQDHQSFRRKKWKYLILDEAQNIKNFKSQRWQLLLNFQSQRRLLLTGTPLQNNLMELWSLMHFLMPNVFQSHREFKEWFSNPVTGMIEGNSQYNENVIRRLHKVLRPFLLRRLKSEVEKQLPKKYEHVLMCRLSKRQRFLYDDFMSRAKTKETLASGNLLSVINVLMQLRKVCNHPNLFEVRPTVSPFRMEEPIEFYTPSLVWNALDYDPMKHVDLNYLNLNLINYEKLMTAFVSHRVRKCQVPRKLIEEIDTQPLPPPKCPSGKIKINIRLSNQTKAPPTLQQLNHQKFKNITGLLPATSKVGTSAINKTGSNQTTGQNVTLRVASGQLHGYSLQLVQHQANVKAIPVQLPNTSQVSTVLSSSSTTLSSTSPAASTLLSTPSTATVSTTSNAQRFTVSSPNLRDGLQSLTSRTVTVKQGDNVQRVPVQNFAQLLQTSTGRHVILTTNQQNSSTMNMAFPLMASGQRLVISPKLMGLSTAVSGRTQVMRSSLNTSPVTSPQITGQLRCGIVTRNSPKTNTPTKRLIEPPKSEFYLQDIDNERRKRRTNKLQTIATINSQRCSAWPLYGDDLFTALRIDKPAINCQWSSGWLHNKNINKKLKTRKEFFTTTNTFINTIKTTEQIVDELKTIIDKFVFYVPSVTAPSPIYHVSHPSQHRYYNDKLFKATLEKKLIKKIDILHPIISSMMTQFPDPRLIQYDCGKLQSLDCLLRKLKTDSHRVLIFTQMTRMLDVLEAFLNCHGYIYLRLDGTTKIDQRQMLMERFNNDKRIFCFILSTRSGGVGVNLTGADTVIFYDSDWNPTMDAQAQDRCHRIGQTRDVHIYRLISEKTIEENILKKANQKRLLGDLAIEGGNFTTAYFKSSTIQDLFEVDQESDATTRMADVVQLNRDRERDKNCGSGGQQEEKIAVGALESALASVEEDLDVQAAKTAKAEAVADLAEFDENIPLEEAEKDDPQVSKAEMEVQNLVSQLTPVERYAMKFVEEAEGSFSAAQLAAAEAELEQQKREWELDRLRALREEEERRMRMTDDDEKSLTYSREDAQNQVNKKTNTKRKASKKQKLLPTRRSTRRKNSLSSSSSSTAAASLSSDESELSDDNHNDDDDDNNEALSSQNGDNQLDTGDEVDSDGDDNDDVDVEDEDEDKEEGEEEASEEERDEDEEIVINDNLKLNSNTNSNSQYKSLSKSERKAGKPNKKPSIRDKMKILNKQFKKNHLDLNSPRTRSRGDVKINLWTLDVSPILPVRTYRKRIDLHKKFDKIHDNGNLDMYDCIAELETSKFNDYLNDRDISFNHDEEGDDDDNDNRVTDTVNIDMKNSDNIKSDACEKFNDNSCGGSGSSSSSCGKDICKKVVKTLHATRSSHRLRNSINSIDDINEDKIDSVNSVSSKTTESKKQDDKLCLNLTNEREKKTSDNELDVVHSNIESIQSDNIDSKNLNSMEIDGSNGGDDDSKVKSPTRQLKLNDGDGYQTNEKKLRRVSTRLSSTSETLSLDAHEDSSVIKQLPGRVASTIDTQISSSSSTSLSRVTRSTANPKIIDNGFLMPQKRSRSNSRVTEIKKSSLPTTPDNSLQFLTMKRRPDTPLPRITRSTIDTNYLNDDNSIKKSKTTRKSIEGKDLATTTATSTNTDNTTDTNGNVNSINIIEEKNERPQRTAKVVAILSLDTHSRFNCNRMQKKNHNDDKKDNDILQNIPDIINTDTECDNDGNNEKKNRKNLRKNSLTRYTGLKNNEVQQLVNIVDDDTQLSQKKVKS